MTSLVMNPRLALHSHVLIREVVRVCEEIDAVMSPSTYMIPGLPAYCTRQGILRLLSVIERSLTFAARLGLSAVHVVKMVLTKVKPGVLAKLHMYLHYVALLEPSVMPSNSSHGFLKSLIRWGSSILPAEGLKVASAAIGLYGRVGHVPPKLAKMLHDLTRMGFDDSQLSVLVPNLHVIAKYLPYLSGDGVLPEGNGLELIKAIVIIVTTCTDLQAQTGCAVLLRLLTVVQPGAMVWFEGLKMEAVSAYLCQRGFELQNGMCNKTRSINGHKGRNKNQRNTRAPSSTVISLKPSAYTRR